MSTLKPKAICFDCETTGLRPLEDKLHGLALKPVGASEPAEYRALSQLTPIDWWGDWLRDSEIEKVNQNVRFDVKFLRAAGYEVKGPLRCTMIAQHLLNENRALGLEAIVENHLGPGLLPAYERLRAYCSKKGYKHVGFMCAADLAGTLDEEGKQLLYAYGAEDVNNVNDVWPVLKGKLEALDKALRERGAKLTPLNYFYDEAMPTEELLAEVELRGIRVDVELVERIRTQLADRKGQIVGELKRLMGDRIHQMEVHLAERAKSKLKTEKAKKARIPGIHKDCRFLWSSGQHLAQLLYSGMPGCFNLPATYTDGGNPSTDDLALDAVAKHEGAEAPTVRELVRLLKEHRNISKNLNTYIGNKARGFLSALRSAPTGETRFYPTYDARIVTGRLGSFAHTFPRDFEITRALVPDPGHVFVYFDYSAIELRIAAHLSQDPEMLRWFREGVDPHRATAARLFGVDESAVTDEQRQVGKRTNFLLIYDGSAWRLEQTLRVEVGASLTVEDCQQFRDAFFRAHPVYRKHMDEILAGLDRRGWILAENGRLRRLPDVAFGRCLNWRLRKANLTPYQKAALGGGSEEELFDKARKAYNHAKKQALNFPVQSLGATITKRACINAAREGYQLAFTKHDSAVFSCKESEVARTLLDLRKIAESSWPLSVPLKADFKILRSLNENDRDHDLESKYLAVKKEAA